jgi:hypothetical protein
MAIPKLTQKANLTFTMGQSYSKGRPMISGKGSCKALAWWLFSLATVPGPAQSVFDYAVRVSATVETNPAQIALSWPADPQATNYTVYRKTQDATSWGPGTTLATNATNYVDSSVAAGNAYEYRVHKQAWTGTTDFTGEGYIYAGIQVPLVESRGKLILLVDNTFTSSLAAELERLQQDLVGDGWTVLRHDLGRTNPVSTIKTFITGDYNADPANVKALFLFGHVPVPYSGDVAPDGHTDHLGAWPADVYYADVNGAWTDASVSTSTAGDPRNWNVPGDGKFDQRLLPSDVELQVGRVDLANLPAFALNEGELLRQYLNKDHCFRHKFVTAQRRGLIDDHFGTFNGEAFAVNGWRNFAPFFGATNIFEGDWLTTLATQSYLWGYGCGSGTPTSASGVGSTSDLAVNDPRVVFTMLFGSWFGDWDSQDNFLRAQLATPTYTLTCAWVGRPDWEFHHMAMGETIGFSTRLSQNNSSTYAANFATRWIHSALMGDPTLRMHTVAPPVALAVVTNESGGVDLHWNDSPDAVMGYHVYRAASMTGSFTRLTTSLLTTNSFTDAIVSSNVYMVRAVKLEQSASGTYYNPSQGVFQSLDAAIAAPSIVLDQPANSATFLIPAALRLVAGAFDPANTITNVAFYANNVKIGECASPPYSLTWSSVPLGNYTLVAQASCLGGQVVNSSPVSVTIDNGGTPRLFIISLGNGSNLISGEEVLGRAYRIQFVPEANATNWQTLGTTVSNASGTFQFIDSIGSTQRFYRTLFP